MGNFTSSSCSTPSRPTTIPSPSPPPPTPSHRKDQTTLTSTLTAHATRLAHPFRLSSTRLDDIEEGLSLTVNDTDARGPHADAEVFNGRRRALLIGIAYNGELSNTHKDVDRYRDMLLGTYGYRAEDVVVLKDDPALPGHLQPTRENILRELPHLVADAAPGDCFTFLYSGHSNQQRSKGLNEQDFKDEYLITIDDEIVVDNELNDILVKPLPVGSSLFALLDTCHSGTLPDLSHHHHCNSAYVPRRSEGKRRTKSWQNVTVRRNTACMPAIQDPISSEAAAASPLRSVIARRLRQPNAYDNSLTRLVCGFLEQNRLPSYKEVMTLINHRLHATLHERTRSEKQKAWYEASAAVVASAYDDADEKKRLAPNWAEKPSVVCGC